MEDKLRQAAIEPTASVRRIVNMTALAAVDAASRRFGPEG
jgi:hypothetical protein